MKGAPMPELARLSSRPKGSCFPTLVASGGRLAASPGHTLLHLQKIVGNQRLVALLHGWSPYASAKAPGARLNWLVAQPRPGKKSMSSSLSSLNSAMAVAFVHRTPHEEDPGYTSPLPSNEDKLLALTPTMVKNHLSALNDEVAAICKNHAFFSDPAALADHKSVASMVQPLNSTTTFKLTIHFDKSLAAGGKTDATGPNDILITIAGAPNRGKREYLEAFYHEFLHAIIKIQSKLTFAEQKKSDIFTKYFDLKTKLKPQRVETDEIVTRTLLYIEHEVGLKPGKLDTLKPALTNEIFDLLTDEGFVWRKETKAFQGMAQPAKGGTKPHQASAADLVSNHLKFVLDMISAAAAKILGGAEKDAAGSLFGSLKKIEDADSGKIKASERLEKFFKALIAALVVPAPTPASSTTGSPTSVPSSGPVKKP